MSHRRFSLILLFPLFVFAAFTAQAPQPTVAQTEHASINECPFHAKTAPLGIDPVEEPDDPDAELLALEVSGKLLPPKAVYNRIQNDLKTIRQAYPEMREVSYYPRWELGRLVLGLTEEAIVRFQNGTHDELNRLNSLYEISNSSCGESLHYCQFTFAKRYNPLALESVYQSIDDVRYVEPKFMIGDGSEIRIDPANSAQYTFIYRWTDCLSGCIHYHTWVFNVSGREVTLANEYGDPLIDPHGSPIEAFAASESSPNIFYFPMMLSP